MQRTLLGQKKTKRLGIHTVAIGRPVAVTVGVRHAAAADSFISRFVGVVRTEVYTDHSIKNNNKITKFTKLMNRYDGDEGETCTVLYLILAPTPLVKHDHARRHSQVHQRRAR